MSGETDQPAGSEDVELKGFTHLDSVPDLDHYVRALETFDAQRELQQLKAAAIAAARIGPGTTVLDVGCGFGLESLRLAHAVGPSGSVTGIDKSADFIARAQRRAASAGLVLRFDVGDAERLPYPDHSFDVVRAERLLIYLDDPGAALREMKRVARPGGRIALIEPDFDTNTINVGEDRRDLTRRILAHECDTGVVQGWLVRDLNWRLLDAGFADIAIETRVVIFQQDLAADYFSRVGRNARQAGIVDDDELAAWENGIAARHRAGRLFCTIGYFLFTATVP